MGGEMNYQFESKGHRGGGYKPDNRSPFIHPSESTLRWEYPEQYLEKLLRWPKVTVDGVDSGDSNRNLGLFNHSLWLKIAPDGIFFLSGNGGRRYNVSTTEKLELFRYCET